MSPKYRQGERVVVLPESGNSNVRPGIYTITRVMPASSDGIQYRARNDMDSYDRVLPEEQLRPASIIAPPMTVDGVRETARSRSSGHRAAPRR